jgi:hypothetical protein
MTGVLIVAACTVAAMAVVAVAQWADRQATGAPMQEWRDRR